MFALWKSKVDTFLFSFPSRYLCFAKFTSPACPLPVSPCLETPFLEMNHEVFYQKLLPELFC